MYASVYLPTYIYSFNMYIELYYIIIHVYIYILLKSTPLTSFPSSVCHASSTALPPLMAARDTRFIPICFGKMECDPGSIRN